MTCVTRAMRCPGQGAIVMLAIHLPPLRTATAIAKQNKTKHQNVRSAGQDVKLEPSVHRNIKWRGLCGKQ